MIQNVLIFMIPIMGTIALFAFVSIATWAEQRRREREAFYRTELLNLPVA